MTDTELLDALKDLIKPINNRLDNLELKIKSINNKLDDLELKMDAYHLSDRKEHRQTQKDIQQLNDKIETLINALD